MSTVKSNQTKSKEPETESVLSPVEVPEGHITTHLHLSEYALILLMRRLKQGYLSMITIKNGLPMTVEKIEQRTQLDNPDNISRMFEIEGGFFPLGRG